MRVCVCVCADGKYVFSLCVCVQRLQGSTKRERQQARVETSLSCRIFRWKSRILYQAGQGGGVAIQGVSGLPAGRLNPQQESCHPLNPVNWSWHAHARPYLHKGFSLLIHIKFSGDIDKTQIIIAGLDPTNHKTSYFHISMIKMFPFYKI